MDHPIYQKKYSASSILSLAWQQYRQNFQTILLIVLAIHLPINLIMLLANSMFSEKNLLMSALTLIPLIIISSLIGVISELAIPYAVKSGIDGRKINYVEALKQAITKWTSGVYTEILMIILLIPLFLLLILPGFFYSIYWMFAVYAVILSNKSGKQALDYSKAAIKGRWWTVFGYSMFFAFITFMAMIPIIIFQYLSPNNLLTQLLYRTVFSLVFSFNSVALIILYLNLEATIPAAKK